MSWPLYPETLFLISFKASVIAEGSKVDIEANVGQLEKATIVSYSRLCRINILYIRQLLWRILLISSRLRIVHANIVLYENSPIWCNLTWADYVYSILIHYSLMNLKHYWAWRRYLMFYQRAYDFSICRGTQSELMTLRWSSFTFENVLEIWHRFYNIYYKHRLI